MNTSKVVFKVNNDELIQKVKTFVNNWLDESDVIHTKTSGSTGEAKVITLSKQAMKNSARMSGVYFGFNRFKKVLLCLSPDTIGGKMLIVRAIYHNMDMLVYHVSKNPIKYLNEEVDFISLVPYQLEHILNESPEKLHFISKVLLGGAPVNLDLVQRLKPYNKLQVYQSFGMTETISHIAIRKLHPEFEERFKGLDSVTFSTVDDQLVIDCPQIGVKQLKTNDLVELHSDSEFSWKGRVDFVINSGGLKYFPETIEDKVSHLFEGRFFISSFPDFTLGEKIVLIVEGSEEHFPNLTDLLVANLERYERPKEIYYVSEFVETESGKINRLQTKLKIFEN